MEIETCTCISIEHLELVQSLSEKYAMPIRSFISALISFAAENGKLPPETFKRLTYRERGTPWKRLHLVLFAEEYEFFMDIRKVQNMSLAKIIFLLHIVMYNRQYPFQIPVYKYAKILLSVTYLLL